MSTSGNDTLPGTDAGVLLGRFARLLADADLSDALALLVRELGLRSAVLRSVDAELLAVAGEVVHAVPRGRERTARGPGVTLPVRGSADREVAALTVVGARPSQLPDLRAASFVLGLALSRDPIAPAADLLLGAEDDRDALADGLHDGPVQSLVAARWAADAALRGGSPAATREAVQDALVAMRRTLWHLRPRGRDDLWAALEALSLRLAEAGQPPLRLLVEPDAAAALAPAARVLAYRVVQAVATGGTDLGVAVRRSGGEICVDVEGDRPLADPDLWRRRLRALGGDLTASAGRLRLVLPATAPSSEAAPPSRRRVTPLLSSPTDPLDPLPDPPGAPPRPSTETKACS